MKLKVGDKVRVKSLEWYNENKNCDGYIEFCEGPYFTKLMSKFCGKEATIKSINGDSYVLDIDKLFYFAEDYVEPISNEFGFQVNNISVSTNTCITLEEGATAKICNENGKTKIMIENNVEEPKFKKGDVVFLEAQIDNKIYQHISIVKNADKDSIHFHVNLCINDNELTLPNRDAWFSNTNIKSIRYATEKEKRTLFLAMLNKGLFFDEKKMKVRTLKDGDIVTIKDAYNCLWYSIFKGIEGEKVYSYASLCKSSNICFGGENPLCYIRDISSIGFSTTEERQTLFDKIEKEEHKKWNVETKKFEKIRWRAKEGEIYWFITEYFDISCHAEEDGEEDEFLFSASNYFQTKELAEAARDKIKELLSKL